MLSSLIRLNPFSVLLYSFLIFFALPISDWQWLISSLISLNFYWKTKSELYTSVYCRGSNHTDRICKFHNLCYNSISKDFIFFHNPKSDIVGFPEDRFAPAVTDFSSIYDHNTQYFNFVDLPSSSVSNFSVKLNKGTAVIFKRFNPENLMHVFHDDLIPAYVTVKEIFLLKEKSNVYFVFADEKDPGTYAYLYENFLDTPPLYLNSILSQIICFENAVVGMNKHSLWYQYGFKEPQGPLNKNMNILYPTLVNFCSYFSEQFKLNQVSGENKTVVLTREYNRKIVNAEAVAAASESVTNFRTHIVNLETFSVIKIIEIIMSSKLVIGMHGSLLILIMFLPQNSHVIELFPYGINPSLFTPYHTLANILSSRITYQSWENKIKENSFPHPEYPPELGGILHLPEYQQKQIESSVVKPFLCCYNIEWLYRIYQDTIVDLQSFSNLLKNVITDKNPFDSNESLVERKLCPSEVQNVSCSINSNIYKISWEEPWNLNFLNATIIEYELWYQTLEENTTKAFIMKKKSFSFQTESNIYVWIRCHVDGKIGPFNTDPFICKR